MRSRPSRSRGLEGDGDVGSGMRWRSLHGAREGVVFEVSEQRPGVTTQEVFPLVCATGEHLAGVCASFRSGRKLSGNGGSPQAVS